MQRACHPARGTRRSRSGLAGFIASAALLALGVSARAVQAGEFAGELTTALRAFDLVREPLGEPGEQDRVRRWRPLDQTVALHWSRLGRRDAWRIDVYARARTDLASGQRGSGDDLDVLLAQARWRSRTDLVRLTLGRQQSITGFGWRVFDGVRVEFPRPRRFRGFVFAGLPQRSFDNAAPDGDSFTAGGGATLVFPGLGSLGVDAVVRRFEDVTTEETLGFDLSIGGDDWRIAANADWDRLLDRFGETTALVRREWGRTGRHALELRFTRVEPIFPADSIWAVFASNPFDERRVSWSWRPRRGLSVGGYLSDDDYEDTELPGEQDLQRVGLTLHRTSQGVRRLVQRADVGWQDGWSGSRLGGRYDADWDVAPRWRLGCGASVQRYENIHRLRPEDETVALRARLHHEHGGRFDVALEVEQFFGRDRDTLRASLVVSTRLGASARRRPWWGDPWGPSWSTAPVGRTHEERAGE